MKKVVFVYPPFLPTAIKYPYLSVPLLSTILEKSGQFETKSFDFNLELNKDIIKEEFYTEFLKDKKGEAWTSALNNAINFAKTYKKDDYIPTWILTLLHCQLSKNIINTPKTLEDYFKDGVKIHPIIEKYLIRYVNQISEESHDVIAFSVAFGEQFIFALEMIKILKKKIPNIPIFLGGAQISLLDKYQIKLLVEKTQIDLIFQGYAEDDIVNIMNKFGLSEKPIVIKGSASTTEKMRGLPFTKFNTDIKYNGEVIFPILVTKGCYWGKCEFCDYILMGDLGGFRYIARPVEDAFAEIKELRKSYPNCEFMLISDAVPPKWYKELATLANKENFPLRTHSYMINNSSLTDDFFKELSKAQVSSFVFGTESTSDRILKLMKKQADRKTILNNLTLARKYDLSVKVNLIPNYPTTTYKEALNTYRDISNFQDIICNLAIFKFYLSANTSMFNNPNESGIEISDSPYLKSPSNGYHTVEYSSNKGMTEKEEKNVYGLFYSLQKSIQANTRKKTVEYYLKNDMPEYLYFNRSIKIQINEGFTILKILNNLRSYKINQEQLSCLTELYNENSIPIYKDYPSYLKNKPSLSDENIKFLIDKELLITQ